MSQVQLYLFTHKAPRSTSTTLPTYMFQGFIQYHPGLTGLYNILLISIDYLVKHIHHAFFTLRRVLGRRYAYYTVKHRRSLNQFRFRPSGTQNITLSTFFIFQWKATQTILIILKKGSSKRNLAEIYFGFVFECCVLVLPRCCRAVQTLFA